MFAEVKNEIQKVPAHLLGISQINYTGTGMIPAAPNNKVRLQNRDCVDIDIMNN